MGEPPFSFTNPGYAERGVAPPTKTTLRGTFYSSSEGRSRTFYSSSEGRSRTFYSSAPTAGAGATIRVDGSGLLLTSAGAYHLPAAAESGAPDPGASAGGAVSASWTAASREDGAASELRRVRWQPQTAATAAAAAAPHKAAAADAAPPPSLDAALLLSQSIEGIAVRAASASVADSGSASDLPAHWEDVTIDLRPGAPPRTGSSPSGPGEVGDDAPLADSPPASSAPRIVSGDADERIHAAGERAAAAPVALVVKLEGARSQGVSGSAHADGQGGRSDEYRWQ